MSVNSKAPLWFWIFAISAVSNLSLRIILSEFTPTTQPMIDIVIMLGLALDMLSSLSLVILLYYIVIEPKK